MDYIISIDIGTQGTKAALFDEHLNLVSSAFQKSRILIKNGCISQSPEDIYSSVLDVLKQLLEISKISNSRIKTIGIDSQMAGIIGIDSSGNAVTWYDSWLDTRSQSYAEHLKREAENEILHLTGSPCTCAHGSKMLWWKNEMPQTYEKIAKFVVPHTYVSCRLAGLSAKHAYLDHTCIQYSGFGDNLNLTWSDSLLNYFGLSSEKVPPIISPFTIIGNISKETASITGLSTDTQLIAGSGDTAASILGAGIFYPGDILDCAGSASVICGTTNTYTPDSQYKMLTLMRSPLKNIWYPLAYINGGGLCLKWIQNLSNSTYETLEKNACTLPCGSEKLIFIPHVSGRNSPSQPYMRGSFIGLTLQHQEHHLYRSIMEGIAYEYALYYKAIKKTCQNRDSPLISIGGGARSNLFLQIKADILNLKVQAYQDCDTALLGTASIAGVSAKFFPDCRPLIKKQLKIRRIVDPVPQHTAVYSDYLWAYEKLLEPLAVLYKKKPFSNIF